MPVETRIEDGLIIVTLNDPGRGNSFGLDSANTLHDLLTRYSPESRQKSQQTVHGLLLRAEGRLFCAGGNLDDYAGMSESQQGKDVNRRITAVLQELASWPLPTVCAVTGDCYGGGVELLSAFDKILAVPEAMFGLWQRRIALTFGWGGGARLEKRLAPAAMKRLAIEARSFSAYEAYAIGLVDEIHMRAKIEGEARSWLKAASRLALGPISGLKDFRASEEQRIFESLWWNHDHRKVLSQRLARKK